MAKDLEDLFSRLRKPEGEKHPQPARLFPVLADTSKEGRTLSMFLACLSHVPEFGKTLLRSLEGVRVLASSEIETYTEVSFESDPRPNSKKSMRPDGLIILKNRKNPAWTALVEAKVGPNKLDEDQLANYVRLAKENKINALITISNDFAAVPHHHPVYRQRGRKPKVKIFHWSWTSIRTHAELLAHSSDLENPTQRLLITELTRFLTHPSSGVQRFGQMAGDWRELLDAVKRKETGGQLNDKSTEVVDAVASWHQETRDLALQLSRLVKDQVDIKLSQEAKKDPQERIAIDARKLAIDDILEVEFGIRNAAAPMSVVADLRGHTISISMKLQARDDRPTLRGQIGWLRRQLKASDMSDMHMFAHWGKNRRKTVDGALADVFANPDSLVSDKAKGTPTHLEVRLIRSLKNFGSKNFITALEQAVPHFYEQVGTKLKKWQPLPLQVPKASAEETSPKSARTSTEATATNRGGDSPSPSRTQ